MNREVCRVIKFLVELKTCDSAFRVHKPVQIIRLDQGFRTRKPIVVERVRDTHRDAFRPTLGVDRSAVNRRAINVAALEELSDVFQLFQGCRCGQRIRPYVSMNSV